MATAQDYIRIEQILNPSGKPKKSETVVAELEQELKRLKKIPTFDYTLNDPHNNSLLMLAAQKGAAFAIGPLLDYKSDIHERRTDGVSPIMIAIRYGQIATAEMLLKCGANLRDIFEDKKNSKGITIEGSSVFSVNFVKKDQSSINLLMLTYLNSKIEQELVQLRGLPRDADNILKINIMLEKAEIIHQQVGVALQVRDPRKPVTPADVKEAMESMKIYLESIVLPETNKYKLPKDLMAEYKVALGERKVASGAALSKVTDRASATSINESSSSPPLVAPVGGRRPK